MAGNIESGFNYCRSCYDHLAGYAGVKITRAMEKNRWIKKHGVGYIVTPNGWTSFSRFGINEEDFTKSRRPLTRQCVDGTEKKPHIAGLLGSKILKQMIKRKWLKRVPSSREIAITAEGRVEINNFLGRLVV